MPDSASLYRRVLGAEFDRLAPPLLRFHESPQGGRAQGTLAVEHGTNWAARLIARLSGVPPATDTVPVTLSITEEAGTERWDRSFGSRRMITWQWQSGPLLVEASRLVAVGFRLTVIDGGLRFSPERVWWCGLRMPRALGPLVAATALPDGDGWLVDVQIGGPLVGTILRYRGRVVPQ